MSTNADQNPLYEFLTEQRKSMTPEGLKFSLAVEQAFLAKVQKLKFAQAVKGAREAAGLSQRKLAKLLGMQQNELSRLEKCKSNPTTETQAKLCHALGIEVIYRVTGTPAPEIALASTTMRKSA